jgi:hypothetical protein
LKPFLCVWLLTNTHALLAALHLAAAFGYHDRVQRIALVALKPASKWHGANYRYDTAVRNINNCRQRPPPPAWNTLS